MVPTEGGAGSWWQGAGSRVPCRAHSQPQLTATIRHSVLNPVAWTPKGESWRKRHKALKATCDLQSLQRGPSAGTGPSLASVTGTLLPSVNRGKRKHQTLPSFHAWNENCPFTRKTSNTFQGTIFRSRQHFIRIHCCPSPGRSNPFQPSLVLLEAVSFSAPAQGLQGTGLSLHCPLLGITGQPAGTFSGSVSSFLINCETFTGSLQGKGSEAVTAGKSLTPQRLN